MELHIQHFARHFVPFFCRFLRVFFCHWSSPFRSSRYLQGNLKGALETNDRLCVRATAQNRKALGRWSLGWREGSTSHGRVHTLQQWKTPRNTIQRALASFKQLDLKKVFNHSLPLQLLDKQTFVALYLLIKQWIRSLCSAVPMAKPGW